MIPALAHKEYRSTGAVAAPSFWAGQRLPSMAASSEMLLDKLGAPQRIIAYGQRSSNIVARTADEVSLERKLFDALVSLKVAVAHYAMHISTEHRHRIFSELDSILNVEDWHQDDQLPAVSSLVSFLKWTIFSKQPNWTSIGISDEGTILVAWRTPRVLLTANFNASDSVRWTARVESETGIEHSAGKSSLQYFAKQFSFVFSE
jgi:hypothetical protein